MRNRPNPAAAADRNEPATAGDSGLKRLAGRVRGTVAAAVAAGHAAAKLVADHSHYVVPAINGFFGDRLARAGHDLAIPFSLRRDGDNVAVADLDLDPGATGSARTAVVFVHGLMADELMWIEPMPGRTGIGARLAADLGVTPLYVRFNSGLHISLLGRSLADLLDDVMRRYGAAIDRMVLVGHSQGGLVVESAIHYGGAGGHDWPRQTEAVFLLGTPSRGAYLEQFSHAAATVLKRILTLQTYAIGSIIDVRSDGIKDLRFGYVVDEDWQRPDADHLLNWSRTEVPLLAHAQYYAIAATLAESDDSWVAKVWGDGMVGTYSAHHRGRGGGGEGLPDNVHTAIFPGTSHAGMALSDDVYEYVRARVADLV